MTKARDMRMVCAALSVLAATPANAADKPPLVLTSTSPWTVDFASERCTLMRMFGTGKEETRLQIDSFGQRDYYTVLVAGDSLPRARNMSTYVVYTLSPDKVKRSLVRAANGKAAGHKSVSFDTSFGPDGQELGLPAGALANPSSEQQATYEQASAAFRPRITSITVTFEDRSSIAFTTGSMAKAFETMNTCVDGLIASWGVDIAKYKAQTRPVVMPPGIIKAFRYPPTMGNVGLNAFAPVRVMVDASGTATRCVVQVPVKDAFQRSLCADMLATHFEPALDADGKPMASVYQRNILFKSTIYKSTAA